MARRFAALLRAGVDADDVVQEALVRAYGALGRFREGANFRSSLLKIVASETFNHNRSLRRRVARERVAASLSSDVKAAGHANR